MARKIVSASYGFMIKGDDLQVDRMIDLRWTGGPHEVFWHGDTPAMGGRPIGELASFEDFEWLKKITSAAAERGHVEDVVGRIHEIDIHTPEQETGFPPNGFSIELLTGQDARDALARRKVAITGQLLREVWWLIPLGVLLVWLLG